MASSARKHSNGASTIPASPASKRPRFVPPPLESTIKTEEVIRSIATSSRYSLRQRSAAAASSSSVKMESELEDIKADEKSHASPSPSGKKAASVKKDPFATSPRKATGKPIKLELDASEARAAPKRWQEQYEVLIRQRKRIIAPVDTMGCEENGREEKRKDAAGAEESAEEKAKRERFTTLVSLMLSSQTKDPVTAEAVHNLQRNLPGGLSLQSILDSTQDEISSNINKVGFWRRKTGYIRSAAIIIRDEFGGDIPRTIDDLCSLPGVGPKMGFLALQSAWGLNVGIGVDVHVHRVANRLKWVNSSEPEGTRLQLQSWLPKEMHRTINKTLVGFGQVICQPVGPRCDLCALGAARLCPSYRRVDPKSVASRVKVELLPETEGDAAATIAVKLEGDDGQGALLIDGRGALQSEPSVKSGATPVKEEESRIDW